jgi:hypothetical protein
VAIATPPDKLLRPSGLAVPRGNYLRPRSMELTIKPARILDENNDRVGAWIENVGGLLEVPIGLPVLNNTFIDSASVQVPPFALSTYKTLVLVVDVAFAWAGALQATLQLIVGRSPWSAVAGAASGAGGNTNNFLKGAAANLGAAAATSLAVGIWPFSPADIADLQWQYPFVGAELKFGGALTAGSARLFLSLSGGPMMLLSTGPQITPGAVGDTAASFALPTQSPPFWYPGGRELYACSSPAGSLDCRIWEVFPQ